MDGAGQCGGVGRRGGIARPNTTRCTCVKGHFDQTQPYLLIYARAHTLLLGLFQVGFGLASQSVQFDRNNQLTKPPQIIVQPYQRNELGIILDGHINDGKGIHWIIIVHGFSKFLDNNWIRSYLRHFIIENFQQQKRCITSRSALTASAGCAGSIINNLPFRRAPNSTSEKREMRHETVQTAVWKLIHTTSSHFRKSYYLIHKRISLFIYFVM